MLPIIFISFAVCFLIERMNLGWKLPHVPTWTIRVLGVNFIQLAVVLLAGISWEKWLSAYSVFHISEYVPNVLGGIFAYFIAHLSFTGGTAGGMSRIFYGGISTKYTTVRNV